MVLAAVALAGCGAEPQLSADAADDLRAGVEDVREAAGAGDRDGALRALEALEARVDRAEDGGRLAAAEAARLRRGIARARRRVQQEVAAPQPTPEPAAEPTPEPAAEATPEPAAEPAPEAPSKGGKPDKGKGPKPGKGDHDDEGDD